VRLITNVGYSTKSVNKMSHLTSRAIDGKINLFVTLADNTVQETYGMTDRRILLRQMKIASLLADHSIISAPYFWQSEITNSVCNDFYPLIDSNTVLLASRPYEQTPTFKDFLFARKQETEKLAKHIQDDSSLIRYGFDKEIPNELADTRAKLLDRWGHYLYRTKSVEILFRLNWQKDVFASNDSNSVCSILNNSINPKLIDKISNQFLLAAEDEYFSRAEFTRKLNQIHEIDWATKNKLIDRLSILYLQANADSLGCYLLEPNGRVYLSKDFNIPDKIFLKYSVDLFSKILSLFGISEQLIDYLSAQDIFVLKNSPEYVNFRSRYFQIIDILFGNIGDYDEIVERVDYEIQQAASLEKKENIYKNILNFCNNAFFAALSTAVGIPLAISTISTYASSLIVPISVPISILVGGQTVAFVIRKRLAESKMSKAFFKFDRSEIKEQFLKSFENYIKTNIK